MSELNKSGSNSGTRRDFMRASLASGAIAGACVCGVTKFAHAEESEIRMCTQMHLPREHEEEANEIAQSINPSNRRSRGFTKQAVEEGITGSVRLAALWGKKWQNGSELSVAFLDGDPEVHRKIEAWAHKWSAPEGPAGIRFKFGASKPQIRISCQPGGSSSYLGTDALHPSLKDLPTMKFGWLTAQSSDDEYSRVVLHEFGHALGAIHEHQHPDSGIPWNKPEVYKHYKNTNGWSESEVNENIFAVYNKSWLQYGFYDKGSIMHYAISRHLTDGVFEVGWNRELSTFDKEIMAQVYPASA